MKKWLVGLSAASILILGGCDSNNTKEKSETTKDSKVESTTKSAITSTKSSESTTTSSSENRVERNAKAELSEGDIKNRVVSYFKQKQNDSSSLLKFTDSMQGGWRELDGKTILTGFVDINSKATWNVQVEENGDVKAIKQSDSSEEKFNIFNVKVDESLNTDISNMDQDELDKRVLALLEKNHNIKANFTTFVSSEFNQTTGDYKATVHLAVARGYGALSHPVYDFNVKANGDYVESNANLDDNLKQGNIINDVSEGNVQAIRDNPTKFEVPPATFEELQSIIKLVNNDVEVVAGLGDVTFRVMSDPEMLYRYNYTAGTIEKNEIDEDDEEGTLNYKYNQEATSKLWEYWTEKGY